MKKHRLHSRIALLLGALFAVALLLTGCTTETIQEQEIQTSGSAQEEVPASDAADTPLESGESSAETLKTNGGAEISLNDLEHRTDSADAPKVFYTSGITPEAMMAVYEAMDWTPTGEVAVKLSTGEPPASNYLAPDLIADLVHEVDGTIVECNTAYGGSRASAAMHYQVAEDHGLTAIADVVIMDENGSISLPVEGGTRLNENYVGAHFADYDSFVVLSHFKGHAMAGFGGAIKNISIGIGSAEGKCWIHSAGASRTSPWGGDQDAFLESMGDAGKSVVNALGGQIVYVNVMNRLSVDCDCDGNPSEPDMHDIGILASTDPVALDQACVDLIYASSDGASLIQRMEKIFSEQLANCGVEYFDYYLLHNMGTNVYEKCRKYDAFGFAARKKEEGKIRYAGMSFHDMPELLDEILGQYGDGLDFVQLQINYVDWEQPNVQSRRCLEVANKYGKPVFVMEPCKGGTLVNLPEEAEKLLRDYAPDASNASWAMRFAASQPGVVRVLSGMNAMEQVLDNTAVFKNFKPLTEEEQAMIQKVTKIIEANTAVACTGCAYCTHGCPRNIAIPQYFALYNSIARNTGSFSSQAVYYNNTALTHGKASDCIGCKQCERACPQHLPITEYLKAVAEKFEQGGGFPTRR